MSEGRSMLDVLGDKDGEVRLRRFGHVQIRDREYVGRKGGDLWVQSYFV